MKLSNDPNKVYVLNTDLRDGRQAPGYSMRDPENLESIDWILDHAKVLKKAQYDVLEAGFPAGGAEEKKIIKEVGKICIEGVDNPNIHNPSVAAMSFMLNLKKPNDYRESLDAAFESIDQLIQYNRGRITMLVSTAPKLREHSTGMSKGEILENAVESGRYVVEEFAKRGGYPNLQYYIEGATQTEPDFLLEVNRKLIMSVIEASQKEGIDAGQINLVASQPDTTGVARPSHYGRLFKTLHQAIPEIQKYGVITSAHCHNDRDNAVANTIAAVENGARQVEVTTLGIGERAGNASSTSVISQLHDFSGEIGGVTHGIDRSVLHDCAKSLSRITGHRINPNQPIHGSNANATGAGIHQNAVAKAPDSYNSLDATDYGNVTERLLLTSMSGKNAVRGLLELKGLTLDSKTYTELTRQLKDQEAGQLTADQFIEKYIAIPGKVRAFEEQDLANGGMNLDSESFAYFGSEQNQNVQFRLVWKNGQQKVSEIFKEQSDKGVVDAAKKAFESLVKKDIKLSGYKEYIPEDNLTSGSEVVIDVTLEIEDQFVRGLGCSRDHNRAAIKAMANALNRINEIKERISMHSINPDG
ncbi:hypothetical protein GF376_04150 [Candidatus Peregrinibacteria bacterium]|nr:hypothetical protein [Candidatus Peregrinibacteria bacterium]